MRDKASADIIDAFSVVIICRDAAETLRECLQSVSRVRNVVVYDNGSSDQTISIARSFANVNCVQGDFLGFGQTKNFAIDLAENDWVLSLDSDELISDLLLEELSKWRPVDDLDAFQIERHNYMMGQCVRYGGWGNDWLVRLFNRKVHRFTAQAVHESVALEKRSQLKRIRGVIIHNAVRQLSEMLDKVNRYSELSRKADTAVMLPAFCFVRGIWAFLKSYFIKLGCLAGWRGLVIAVSNFNGVFFKYMKAYSRHRR